MSIGPQPFPGGSPADPTIPLPATAAGQGPLSRRRRGSIVGLAGATWAGIALGLVTGPITARVLGPTGKGEVAAAAVYAAFAATILGLGVPNAAGFRRANRLTSEDELLGAVIRWAAFLTVPSIALGAVVVAWPLHQLHGSSRVLTFLLVATAPLGMVGLGSHAILRARGELGSLSWLRLLPILLSALGTISLWLAGHLTVTTALATTLFTGLASLVAVQVTLGVRPRRGGSLRPLISFGARSLPGILALTMSGQLDQALVAPLLGVTQLGVYSVASTISTLPLGLTAAIATRAFGSIGEAPTDERLVTAARYVRMSLLAATALTLGLAAIVPWALPLIYGTKFAPSVIPALLLLPGTVAMSGMGATEASLNVLGRPGKASLGQLGGTLITVLGLPLTLPAFGIQAAAAVTSLDFIVTFLIQATFLSRVGCQDLVPRIGDVPDLVQGVLSYLRGLPGARHHWNVRSTVADFPPAGSDGSQPPDSYT